MAETIVRESRAGDGFVAAGREKQASRERRALRLYAEHGHKIEQAGAGLYWVPSQDGAREYLVVYPVGPGQSESCSCPDHQYGHRICIHILATAIHCAKKRAQRRRNFIAAYFKVAGEAENCA